MRLRSKAWHLLLALIAVGAALRVYHIGQKGFWLDEMLTLLRITAGLEDTPKGIPLFLSARLDAQVTTIPMSHIWAANPWGLGPPLYYFLLKGWIGVVGGGDGAIRLLPSLLSILTIPVGFLAGRQLGGTSGGLILAGLLATSPINLYYAQENRNYALLVLTVLLSYYALLRLRNESNRLNQAIYALVTAAALYTHYFAGGILAAQASYVAWQRDRRFAVQWATAALAAGLLFLPWIPQALVDRTYAPQQTWLYQPQSAGISFLKAVTLPFALVFSSEFFLTYRISWELARRLLLQCAGFVACWVVLRRKFPAAVSLLAGWIFVPIAALLALDLVTGSNFLNFTRYAVMINPAVYLLLTLVILTLEKRWSWLWLCFLLGVHGHVIDRYYKQPYKVSEWREAAAYIRTKVSPGELILLYESTPRYYGVLPSSLALLARNLPFREYPFLLADEASQNQALAHMPSHLAFLTVYSDVLPAWAENHYVVQDQASFTNTGTVWILAAKAPKPKSLIPVP